MRNDSDHDVLKFLIILLHVLKLTRMLGIYWTDMYASLSDLKDVYEVGFSFTKQEKKLERIMSSPVKATIL